MKLLDSKFKTLWPYFIMQSIFACFAVFCLLYILEKENAIIVASIGATAFIVFSSPSDKTAQTKNIIGGHLIGVLAGFICYHVPHFDLMTNALVYALAVGIAFFIMVTFDLEHPPAAATALGIALTGFSLDIALTILVSTVILSFFHACFKPILKDLL